jgi:hypothetical protein
MSSPLTESDLRDIRLIADAQLRAIVKRNQQLTAEERAAREKRAEELRES